MQPDEIADVVAVTLKAALAPFQAEIAGLRGELVVARKALDEIVTLRDKLIVLETKSAATGQAPSWDDLAKVREALAVADTKLAPLSDVRDRLLTLETKGVPTPAAVDLAPVFGRIAEAEHQVKSAATVAASLAASVTDLTKDVVTVREKVADVAARAGVPGPAGKDGANGQNGRDGVDGTGWDDLAVEHDGERTFTVKMMRGERVKDAGSFTIPAMIYRGPYADGRTYEPGDVVSWAGSTWHCKKQTALKPDTVTRDPRTGEPMGGQGKDFWSMLVKAGREGRAAERDQPTTLPVVSVGGR